MYEAFFGLRERPFNLTPDPKYLYLSEKHKEAFAHLLYGIKNRSGFVMITGEIGTGKTTLCRNLLNQLDSGAEVAFIFNSFLDPIELLKKINQEFGITSQATTVLGLTEELNEHLLHSAAHGRNCVLVIDEAQNLSPQVLEQIRLLSNIETDSSKLLQIILIGQPELAEKLQLQELRQLNQRITARYHLKALNVAETLEYIAYRIYVAGGRKRVNFTRKAAKCVFKLSGGVPRMINAICDRALLIAYTKEERAITVKQVRQAMREIRGEKVAAPKNKQFNWKRWLPAPSMAALFIVALALVHYLGNPLDQFARELHFFNAILSGDMQETGSGGHAGGGVLTTSGNIVNAAVAANGQSAPSGVLGLVIERLNESDVSQSNQALAPIMVSLKPEDTLRAGIDMLTSLWNKTLADAYPEERDAEELAAFFNTQALECERLSPSLNQIYSINLPGLARMRFDENEFWVAVARMNEKTITLLVEADRRMVVSHGEFNRYYQRELMVPWRDLQPDAPILSSGQRGPQVLALKEDLRGLGRLSPNNINDVYDTETEAAVFALQREIGLKTDGKAGRQMRLALAGCESGAPALHRSNTQTAMISQPGRNLVSEDSGKKSSKVSQSSKNTSRPKAKKTTESVLATTQVPPQVSRNIENAIGAPEELFPWQIPPLADIVAEMEQPAGETVAKNAPGGTKQTDAPLPGLLATIRQLAEPKPQDADVETGKSGGTDTGSGVAQVRELPDPAMGADASEGRFSSVTDPVIGSMPLVPHLDTSS